MYQLVHQIDEKTNVYSSFACTCKQTTEHDYIIELIKILNNECSLKLMNMDEVYNRFGYELFDQLTYLLDEQGYGITSIITDMWSGMRLSHLYQPNNFPNLYVQYDQFIFGFVDAYHLAKLAVSFNKLDENNEIT